MSERNKRGQFARGHKRLGGRAPGTPNRVSADAKRMMDELVEHGLDDAIRVYDTLKRKSPGEALKALARFSEFRLPKLERKELSGPNGEPLRTVEVVQYVGEVRPAPPARAEGLAGLGTEPKGLAGLATPAPSSDDERSG